MGNSDLVVGSREQQQKSWLIIEAASQNLRKYATQHAEGGSK